MAKKYVYRVEELEEIKVALNILKTKIRFTYEPIPEIFTEIAQNTTKNIKNIFGTNKKQGVSNFCETVELSTKNPLKETVKMTSKSDLKYINKFF